MICLPQRLGNHQDVAEQNRGIETEAAHRWKSALDLLGARRALAWTVRLEEACGANEKEHLMECFNNLCTELDSLEKAMSLTVKENAQCKSC